MNHRGTVPIETSRLLLRRFVEGDAPAAFRNWTGDERVTEYLRWATHDSVAATESILREWIASYQTPGFYVWAIEWKELREPIGTISVVDQNEDLGIVHIGYCIGSRWWRRGIMSEALSALIPFFFEEVGANRIESQHDPHNPNSGRVMRKCGLKFEGVLRQADRNNRGIVDAAVYSMLASEYYEAKERNAQ